MNRNRNRDEMETSLHILFYSFDFEIFKCFKYSNNINPTIKCTQKSMNLNV